ncbi:radical SAM family heme chaperone HemW [Kiloniella laminariae]|uniref:Heme chaperone HemW n=1 Tax=Kiloniella laminariae TaxID=454162 RepID=A0ABT4LJF9_9PROT|nr:radical SAM family heme chaperone HemW [Kiloniella laminariae]MCZ4281238.1 radical SAM family heme chaperone HemW [Kiloniella laminariae]
MQQTNSGTVPAAAKRGFGIYIHWPFCLKKCPYCDFNSHVREDVSQSRWRAALLQELNHYAELLKQRGGEGRIVSSVFFGGGTPSLMAPETVAALINRIRQLWPTRNDLEITLEANPTSVEAGKFAAFSQAGVNRVSLGIQSLNDEDLKFLGREHSASEALAAIDVARKNFERFSFDLIYARPEQDRNTWKRELERALGEGTGHLSLYQLTIEENTVFHAARRRGELKELDQDKAAELYELTNEIMAEKGLPGYEVSNYARPGEESRHNLTYWRYGDYIGIGPGAHGRLTLNPGEASSGSGNPTEKLATRQHRAPEIWLETVEQAAHATRNFDIVSDQERFEEMIMMGLRLKEGISLAEIRLETGQNLEQLLPASRLAALGEEGLLVKTDSHIRATSAGRIRLNTLLSYLLG